MANTATSSITRLLKTLSLVLIVIASSVGVTFYILKSGMISTADSKTVTTPTEPEIPLPIFLALDPFTVTLHDAQTERILYLELTLRVSDDASRRMLIQYMPEVRNRVLTEVSNHNPIDAMTSQGRSKLAKDLTGILKTPYQPQPYGPQITQVLFTAFVVQ